MAQRGEVREQDGGSVQTTATLEKIKKKKIRLNFQCSFSDYF